MYIKQGIIKQKHAEKKVHIDQLTKMLWPEVHRNLALYFPLGIH